MTSQDWLHRLQHDLSGPLHSLSGFLELLDADLAGGKTPLQRNCLENLRLALDSMAKRVQMISEAQPPPSETRAS